MNDLQGALAQLSFAQRGKQVRVQKRFHYPSAVDYRGHQYSGLQGGRRRGTLADGKIHRVTGIPAMTRTADVARKRRRQ